jgi:hypothetical protein
MFSFVKILVVLTMSVLLVSGPVDGDDGALPPGLKSAVTGAVCYGKARAHDLLDRILDDMVAKSGEVFDRVPGKSKKA